MVRHFGIISEGVRVVLMSDRTDRPRDEFDSRALTTAFAAVIVVAALLAGWFIAGALQVAEHRAFQVTPTGGEIVADVRAAETSAPVEADPVAPSSEPVTQPNAAGIGASGNSALVDAAWAESTAAATGIPVRALLGYAGAELAMERQTPGCGIRWNTLAALGLIESAHGTHAGSVIAADGVTTPGIFGIDLDGSASARIGDSDAGVWDGTATIDRAVGPLQFIPATWERWGADGNADGRRDPQQIDDAALGAARYLCHYGDLTSAPQWRTAIFAYNHLDSYVAAVAHAADDYAARAAR